MDVSKASMFFIIGYTQNPMLQEMPKLTRYQYQKLAEMPRKLLENAHVPMRGVEP
jgi:hypothetical protein